MPESGGVLQALDEGVGWLINDPGEFLFLILFLA